MILLHTTKYKALQKILQTIQNCYAPGLGQRPAGSTSAAKKRPRKPVEAFSGGRTAQPPSRGRFRASWALLGRLGAAPCPGPASSFLAMGYLRLAAVIVGSGDPSSSAAAWGSVLPPFPLGVQPAAFPPAPPFDVGHGLGTPLFPAKPLLRSLGRRGVECGRRWWSWRRRGVPRPSKPGRRPAIVERPTAATGRRKAAGRRERSDRRAGAPAGRLGHRARGCVVIHKAQGLTGVKDFYC